ncbi:gliding motility-associated C-terminal domain-containing protein [Flavihumibacter rivuli]|uniref:lectin-like domain-containing protein n=1 Tax=Flavihumibacter rivuli TaxID=2838156 RepID=UPI001BDE5F58|nr:PKD domain-containing protein [Flavihumibacter rivuli]ULQ55081.1 gliding motility-associated C-terminal domain-containing protein [Flavihumibacter rivuli]
MKPLKRIALLFMLFLGSLAAKAQRQAVDSPYILNGAALKENCNCYTITPDEFTKSGSVWNINKIDLTQSFDFSFEVFLGCTDAQGADGIVFVLQPISTSVGSTGEGLGFEGITPSIGVVLDTWQNGNLADPGFDHISIHRDGDNNHNSPNNLAGPISILPNSSNIEDCQWHSFRIRWNPATREIATSVDGVERLRATVDLVNDVFKGDPKVFWGFTGATGGAKNQQRFCTSLNPVFSFPPDQVFCYPATIEIVDQSRSFGRIDQWYWDFGDGRKDTTATPLPHTYSQPGIYDISLSILGANGCVSEKFTRKVTIGTIPRPAFQVQDPLCEGDVLTLQDISTVEVGTINQWTWTINGNSFSGQQPPSQPTIVGVPQTISLALKTAEGCEAVSPIRTVNTFPRPAVNFDPAEACAGQTIELVGQDLRPAVPINQWNWIINNQLRTGNSVILNSNRAAELTVQLFAESDQGCPSDTITQVIRFYQTRAFAGNDTIAAIGEPIQLNGSGGTSFQWTPATGLSDPSIPNPVATLNQNTSYVLTASSPIGCETRDTINIKVYKGPAIYVPNAFTPNGDNKNDRFRFTAVGMRKLHYFRIYNRLGQLLFDNTSNIGWDGKLNGLDQPAGNYVWMISGEDNNGKAYVQKGSFILVR